MNLLKKLLMTKARRSVIVVVVIAAPACLITFDLAFNIIRASIVKDLFRNDLPNLHVFINALPAPFDGQEEEVSLPLKESPKR